MATLFVQAAVAAQIHGSRRERETGSRFLDNLADTQQDIFLDGEELVPIPGQGIDPYLDVLR